MDGRCSHRPGESYFGLLDRINGIGAQGSRRECQCRLNCLTGQARMCRDYLFDAFAGREFSRMSSTVNRVPRITGLPIMMEGSL